MAEMKETKETREMKEMKDCRGGTRGVGMGRNAVGVNILKYFSENGKKFRFQTSK